MTGDELRDARRTLGEAWGLARPLTMDEMGRLLRLAGKEPGTSIRDYEREKTRISGPIALAVELMIDGAKPRDLTEILER